VPDEVSGSLTLFLGRKLAQPRNAPAAPGSCACVPGMPFQLGGVYRITLFAGGEDDKDGGEASADLFKKGFLKDRATMVFRIEARSCMRRETRSGEVTESVRAYEMVPNQFGSSIMRMELRLLRERTDLVEVDCSSYLHDERYLVKCAIAQLTEAEVAQAREEQELAAELLNLAG